MNKIYVIAIIITVFIVQVSRSSEPCVMDFVAIAWDVDKNKRTTIEALQCGSEPKMIDLATGKEVEDIDYVVLEYFDMPNMFYVREK